MKVSMGQISHGRGRAVKPSRVPRLFFRLLDMRQQHRQYAQQRQVGADFIHIGDARHVGQNFELNVAVAEGAALDRTSLPDARRLRELFLAAHDLAYGFHDAEAPVEVINLRLVARLPLAQHGLAPSDPAPASRPAPRGERPVLFRGKRAEPTPVYRREDLTPGAVVEGPALIEQLDATTPIFPGDRACVDAAGNLIIEVSA